MAALPLPTTHLSNFNTGISSERHHYKKHFLGVQLQRRCRDGCKSPWTAANIAQRRSNLEVSAVSQSSVERIQPGLDSTYETGERVKDFSYLFRTEIGGLVKTLVATRSTKYVVKIEVSALPQSISEDNLILSWSMFRSDSSSLYVPIPQTSSSETSNLSSKVERGSMKTPFTQNSLGVHTLELEFDPSQAPFYLSFLLHPSDAANTDPGLKTHRKTRFCVPVGIGRGYPFPLGISMSNDGSVNFSLFSRNAESIILCLYDGETNQPSQEIELDPYVNRTGDIWHVFMESVGSFVKYGYRCKGEILSNKGSRFHTRHVLLDPYARVISKFFPDHGESISLAKCLGYINKETAFDWSGDAHPCVPMENMAVYRLNVGNFTKDKSSGLPENVAGTFVGVTEKIQHLIDLGINAVLLEPIFPFDEQKGPYFPYHFFSPMISYGPTEDGLSSINSMKEMVKSLHAHGIEVLMEVVFTHTSEGGDASCQAISFRGIDNSSYYIVHGDMGLGTDNALNCNNPIAQQLIIDSLRHWLIEFHIDGFCFVDSSSLVRGSNGVCLSRPPLVEAIAFDPILSKTKIIADCWSPVDMSYTEINFPHWKRWAQMNTRFSSDVRNFLRGEGLLSDLATRICGSGDLFSNSRGPAFSFNYVAKNFGLPLVDLLSFSNNDLASELSWNCGDEGPTSDSSVLELRLKQMRNFLFVLFISLGVPVLNMGDECGYSTAGSPAYNDRKPIDWDAQITSFATETTQFIAFLSSLRKRRSDFFQRRDFLEIGSIDWHGSNQSPPRWEDPSCKFLSMRLKGDDKGDELPISDEGDLFVCFNASDLSESVLLPQISEGTVWLLLVDTSLPFPVFFASDDDPNIYVTENLSAYELKAHSCVLFEAKRIVAE